MHRVLSFIDNELEVCCRETLKNKQVRLAPTTSKKDAEVLLCFKRTLCGFPSTDYQVGEDLGVLEGIRILRQFIDLPWSFFFRAGLSRPILLNSLSSFNTCSGDSLRYRHRLSDWQETEFFSKALHGHLKRASFAFNSVKIDVVRTLILNQIGHLNSSDAVRTTRCASKFIIIHVYDYIAFRTIADAHCIDR